MSKNDKPVVVYSTFPSDEAARELGAKLVEKRLAACVNIIPGMVSLYVWKGEMQHDREVVMIIKSRRARVDALTEFVETHHPYDTPALVTLDVLGGSSAYIDWIFENTQSSNA